MISQWVFPDGWRKHGNLNPSPTPFVVMGFLSVATPMCELKGHKLGGFYKFLQPCLMVRSPDVIETILVTKFNCFHDNWSHVSHEADPLASRSPFFMTGDRGVRK
ncbi:unnamed protein product, partial [Timema podura]|nr:unnamed protein product [Timema podura]